jgi:hypothetical protein
MPQPKVTIDRPAAAAGHLRRARRAREALLTLSRQAKERGWWQSYVSAIPEWFQVYVGLEAEASTVHLYESELVDGLLQTPGYYRTFLRAAPAAAGENEAERKIEVRLARQERLTSDDPPEYWAVLNEAVIRRVVGGAEVMRAQLGHITEMARLPHVNVQVLPFSAGVHPAMDGSFRILGFPEAADPDVVYLENQAVAQLAGIKHDTVRSGKTTCGGAQSARLDRGPGGLTHLKAITGPGNWGVDGDPGRPGRMGIPHRPPNRSAARFCGVLSILWSLLAEVTVTSRGRRTRTRW